MNKKSIRQIGRLITTFFSILLLCSFAGNAYGQTARVTVKMDKVPMKQVMSEIENQTKYLFLYAEDIDTGRIVSVNVESRPLSEALAQMLKGTDIAYEIDNSNIVLSRKKRNESEPVTVRGTVRYEKGDPVIGASVIIKGTTTGTSTGIDGSFTLQVPQPSETAVIVISYMGTLPEEVTVGSRRQFDVVLREETISVEAVVVTALGIRKEEKSLTYNVQEVGGREVNTVKDANFMNSLTGKVAGLQINASASGAGGSTRVVMRGVKSINGDNNALYVLDGIPLPSLRANQTESIYDTPDGGDYEGIANLNPEDIESMSVLTGATAAALYGSQGANGVILITTKKGTEGKTRVSYSNSSMFSSPFVMPRFQNIFGTDVNSPSMSWGEKLPTPSSYDPKDFFQTGFDVTNSVSVMSGTSRNQTYASAAATNTRGIVPNQVYNRYNFTMRNTSVLVEDKLTLDLGGTYMRQYSRNPTIQGIYHNPLIGIYLFPVGDDISKYRVFERYNPNLGYSEQFWGLEFLNGVENPYWVVNRQLFENTAHRFTFNATMKWDITEWMSLTGRAYNDYTAMNYTRKISATSNTLFASDYGNYLNHKNNHNSLYADAILSIDKSFCYDLFSLNVNLGASLSDDQNSLTGFEGNLAGLPNKFTFNNIVTSDTNTLPMQETYHDQNQAVFATMQAGFKRMIFLDLTARNEWASQLAFTRNLNIFYPSAGLSVVVSSMADLSGVGISFLKFRGSYAEVGNPPPRYITGRNYSVQGGVVTTETYAPATHLQPERTKSYEAGMNVKFFRNKVWLDATYYNTNTYNQLFLYDAPPSTGYKQSYINAGKINNWGLEAVAGYKNKWNNFAWTTSFNFSMNRNEIKELVPEGTVDPVTGTVVDIPEVNMDFGGYRIKLQKGGSIGDFYVTGLLVDDQGNIYVDPNSGTVKTDPDTWLFAGNTEARYRMGWNNRFEYGGFSLGMLVDARIGGRGVSVTQALMDRFGVSAASAQAREAGGVRLSDNQLITGVRDFYNNSGDGMAMMSQYVYEMTNCRLRELSLGYDLPSKWFRNRLSATVSLVGRNLFMFYNKAPFDPELTPSTGTYYQNIDFFMQPSHRSLGFSVKLQF